MASGLGCGYSPFAPGTVGSLAGLLVAAGAHHFTGMRTLHLSLVVIISLPLAVWASGREASRTGRKDPQVVVVDEVVGQWVALLGVSSWSWRELAAALLCFRLFDVWKPFPARQAELLPGGIGIVADDVAAGLWALLVLRLAGWFN